MSQGWQPRSPRRRYLLARPRDTPASPPRCRAGRFSPDPLAAATSLDAVGTFGDSGVVVAGAGAAVAVSGDGGATWTNISASGSPPWPYTASRSRTLSTASPSAMPAPSWSGRPTTSERSTWTAATLPHNVNGDVRDVAMSGTIGYAVGDRGLLLQTVDGGATLGGTRTRRRRPTSTP